MATLELLDTTRTARILGDLESKLRSLVVGQDEAIHELVTAYQSHMMGLSPAGGPIGNFLFLGPTGSGKTRAGTRARDLSQRAYEAGAITLTDVLDADRQLLVARTEVESTRSDAARAAVSTFRALGGGWDVQSNPSLRQIK